MSKEFDDEEPTWPELTQSMEKIMETLRAPGVPTATSEIPTRPFRRIDRPSVSES